ncbi:outer membrane lipoprotein carrier protein LolA [Phytohalomonas tamaricis]|uniref:outer membrane lipoprotein carrier protein LolA n=1 Tax=Phytohalomonas tamaricis TaxID=2081032 RepID=UPI000D0BB7D5|nr:outer membrane lipoprotein carrier protein LolA [Phytohalomonas tamaricis]
MIYSMLMALRLPLLLAMLVLPLSAQAMSLDELNAQLSQTAKLSGRFVQERYLKDLDTTLESHGRFDYVRGKEVHWHLEKPVEEELTLDKQGIHRDGQPIDDDPSGVARLILQLMDGNLQALDDRFRISLEGDKDAWQALLIPRQPGLANYIDAVRLSGGRLLDRVQMNMHDGDRLTVLLDAESTAAKATDADAP